MRRLFAALICWLVASSVRAEVQRFALIVGNNLGHADDAPLLYAESDARKVHAVLRELGGFQPQDMILLQGEDAVTVRRALIALNARIRSTTEEPGAEALLFVYYSGHADAGALRLGAERIELSELKQLVRGSAATFRLMVMDACRSGQLTRVKGGRMIEPFGAPAPASLTGEGTAFLTASAPTEDAQESDEIQGSFFTHAFVSGLLGAADLDGDGAVVLEEAYRYSYDATLRATSRTAYGLQHPSFKYDFRGHGTLVLTRPASATGRRGILRLPRDFGFLVMQDDGDGPVVAELSPRDTARALSLRPGTYFLRGRGTDLLLEGSVSLRERQDLSVDPERLRRVEYARLVRKGARDRAWAQALDVGASLQGRTPTQGAEPCWGGALGYTLDLPRVSLLARFATCHAQFENDLVETRTDEYDVSLGALYPWDFRHVTVAAGVAAGAVIAHQRFETAGDAPSRTSAAPSFALITNLTVDVIGPTFLRLDARAATELARMQPAADEEPELVVSLSLRASLLAGVYLGSTVR